MLGFSMHFVIYFAESEKGDSIGVSIIRNDGE